MDILINLPSIDLWFSDSFSWFGFMRFRNVEKSLPTSKVGYSFVFLKWPNPGSLNASIETKEQINMKARQLLMVKDQENMSCNSPLVSFYKTIESARRMLILILDSLIFKSGFLCAQTWIAKLWLRFHLGFSSFPNFSSFFSITKSLDYQSFFTFTRNYSLKCFKLYIKCIPKLRILSNRKVCDLI